MYAALSYQSIPVHMIVMIASAPFLICNKMTEEGGEEV